MKSFEDGELFVYIDHLWRYHFGDGDKAEIGKVKCKNKTGDGYFCYYNEGDTAENIFKHIQSTKLSSFIHNLKCSNLFI